MPEEVRPGWALELRDKIDGQRESLGREIKAVGDKVDGYVETLGQVKGSHSTLQALVIAAASVFVATTLGGGIWAGLNQSALNKDIGELKGSLGGLSANMSEVKGAISSASAKSQSAAQSADAAGRNVSQVGNTVAGLTEKVNGLAKTIEGHGAEIRSIETLTKKLDADLTVVRAAQTEAQAGTKELTGKVADLETAIGKIPTHGREIAIRFQLGARNRVDTSGEETRPGLAVYTFEVEFASPAAIAPESVSQVRAALDPVKFDELGFDPIESLICTPSVEKPNVLTIRLSVSDRSSALFSKVLTAKPAFSGQAFIYLRPASPQPKPD